MSIGLIRSICEYLYFTRDRESLVRCLDDNVRDLASQHRSAPRSIPGRLLNNAWFTRSIIFGRAIGESLFSHRGLWNF